jgi:Protein of unknown function DUF262
MKKEHNLNEEKPWTIDRLSKSTNIIEFPEFQRDPTVWRLDKKERLIDSIVRGLDISSIYFFKRDDGKFDCIDGQQRINAIWSYLGINKNDPDNAFNAKIENEVYNDKKQYADVHQKRFEYLDEQWKNKILEYELNIIFITKTEDDDELSLQFIRLQLGATLRAGEKLNAMMGDMRDFIFNKGKDAIIEMDYFIKTSIRKGRFGRQEVVAQLLLNAFSKKENGEYHRSRYLDLQDFFKKKEKFTGSDKKIIEEVKHILMVISKHFKENLKIINSKAIAVSVFLFISELIELNKEKDIDEFVSFLVKFLKTKEWQVTRGLDMNRAYREILNFQTSLTQAAGEKTAIQNRHDFWRDYFSYYKKEGLIKGDKEYEKVEGKNPDDEREKTEL